MAYQRYVWACVILEFIRTHRRRVGQSLLLRILLQARQFDESEEALARLQDDLPTVAQIRHSDRVTCPQERHGSCVTGVGLGDGMVRVCHGSALHNRIVVVHYLESVRVMLIFVVDLQGAAKSVFIQADSITNE